MTVREGENPIMRKVNGMWGKEGFGFRLEGRCFSLEVWVGKVNM
jgi:hypothetical protein